MTAARLRVVAPPVASSSARPTMDVTLKVPRRLNDIRKRGPRRYANGRWFKRPDAWDTVTTETQRKLLLAHLAATTPPARTVDREPTRVFGPAAWTIWIAVGAALLAMALR